MTSPLRMERLMTDVWYAVSMYFADRLKKSLMAQQERGLWFVLLVLLLTIQRALEHWIVHWFQRQQSLWSEIVVEYIYMCSRTLAFLMVSFAIDMLATQHSHDFFWGEKVLVPAMVMLVGIAALKYVQHIAALRKYK